MAFSDEQALGVFERKILRSIYGRFCDIGEWRIQWNQELYGIYRRGQGININRLRWLGQIARMDSSNPDRKDSNLSQVVEVTEKDRLASVGLNR